MAVSPILYTSRLRERYADAHSTTVVGDGALSLQSLEDIEKFKADT